MRIKLILPALTEAHSTYWRPIKYSLFPPLGLATLAGYVPSGCEVTIHDEHVEKIDIDDEPDIVVIQAYITNAYRAYELADHYRRKGSYVCLGGLHVTSLPEEAALHADSIFLGPGEDTWPEFLRDYNAGAPRPRYQSLNRSLSNMPPVRRSLFKRELYLVPNSIVVSRGCPHKCDFCYKEGFFKGGRSFYTREVDAALKEISELPGRHLFFLDDNLFADAQFASALFEGMKGMNRIWQAAGTVQAVMQGDLLEKAAESGLRSLFIGFETLSRENLNAHRKVQNMRYDYSEAARRLHDLELMINGSFVFGMDQDDATVFDHTVDWAVRNGIETATFHILTPYPGTALYEKMRGENRMLHSNWDLYDTRHVVFQPKNMTAEELEAGYWRSYDRFYSWSSILQAANTKDTIIGKLRHLAYTGGWKKFENFWSFLIRQRQVTRMLPLLEFVLSAGKSKAGDQGDSHAICPPIPEIQPAGAVITKESPSSHRIPEGYFR